MTAEHEDILEGWAAQMVPSPVREPSAPRPSIDHYRHELTGETADGWPYSDCWDCNVSGAIPAMTTRPVTGDRWKAGDREPKALNYNAAMYLLKAAVGDRPASALTSLLGSHGVYLVAEAQIAEGYHAENVAERGTCQHPDMADMDECELQAAGQLWGLTEWEPGAPDTEAVR